MKINKPTSVRIDRIEIGERRRTDYGDIDKLAKGIEKVGLLNPLIVRRMDPGRFRLVAGGRRLKALQLLKKKRVEVRVYEQVDEDKLREIELEENENRKDFTDKERRRTFTASKQMNADARRAAEVISISKAGLEKKDPRGRKPEGKASKAEIAAALGVSDTTLINAAHHVETAEEFPFMQSWRQSEVLAAREELQNIPEAERENAVGVIACAKLMDRGTAVELLENIAAKTPAQRTELYALSQSDDPRDRSKALSYAAELPPLADPRINAIETALAALCRATKPYPRDPLTPEFMKVITELRRLKKLVEAVSHDARRDAKKLVVQ